MKFIGTHFPDFYFNINNNVYYTRYLFIVQVYCVNKMIYLVISHLLVYLKYIQSYLDTMYSISTFSSSIVIKYYIDYKNHTIKYLHQF